MIKTAWMPENDPEHRLLGKGTYQCATVVELPLNQSINAATYFAALSKRVQKLVEAAYDPEEALEEINHLLDSENLLPYRTSNVRTCGECLILNNSEIQTMLSQEGLTFPIIVKEENPQAQELLESDDWETWVNAITCLETERD